MNDGEENTCSFNFNKKEVVLGPLSPEGVATKQTKENWTEWEPRYLQSMELGAIQEVDKKNDYVIPLVHDNPKCSVQNLNLKSKLASLMWWWNLARIKNKFSSVWR